MEPWQQFLIAILAAVGGGATFNVYLNRKMQRQTEQITGTAAPASGLNGYASILKDALAQLRFKEDQLRIKDEEIALLRRQLADCEQRKPPVRRTTPRKRAS